MVNNNKPFIQKRGLHTLVAKEMDPEDFLAQIIGRKFKNYRDSWDAAGKGGELTKYPLHLNFEISYGCNYKCNMCLCSRPHDEWGYNVEPKKRIGFEKYKEIIDEGVEMGLGAISLNGYNEPLLQKDICQYIRYAHEKGVSDVFFVTNGSMLDKKKAGELLESGLTRILFSLDAATPETYSKVRKEGGYKKVLDNILYFLRLKKERGYQLPITRVSFVRSKFNYLEQEQFENFWKDKVDYILIQRFTNPFMDNPIYDKEGNLIHDKVEQEYRIEDSEPLGDCYQPFQRLYITNNGDVHPCCSAYGLRITLGNIYEDSISNIWNNTRSNGLRKTVNAEPSKQPAACRLCREASAAKHTMLDQSALPQEVSNALLMPV